MDFLGEEDKDGIRCSWNVFPSNKVDAAKMVVPLGCTYTPMKPNVTQVYYEHVKCRGNCSAVLNPFCAVDFRTKIWVCPICLARNQLPNGYNDINENNLPAELIPQYSTIEYVNTRSQFNSPPVFLFLIDTCLEEQELHELKNSLIAALNLIPENSLLGLITFGKTVQVYEIGFEEIHKSFVFNGAKDYTSQQIQQMLYLGKQTNRNLPQGAVPPRVSKFLMPIAEAEFTITSILEELQRDPYPVKSDRRPLRSTGAAVSIAIGLLEHTVPDSGARVMLFTGGPCSVGPGMVVSDDLREPIRSHTDLVKGACKYTQKAMKHYEAVATRAVKSGHTIDVFASALDQPGFYEMQDLVKKTGGLVVLSDSFDTPMFKQSFMKIFARDGKGAFNMAFNATIEVQTTRDLKVTGAIGHCASLAKKAANVAETEIGIGGTNSWKMCGIDPLQTIAFYFESANQQAIPISPGQKSVIQIQTSYQNGQGAKVLRITTFARDVADLNTNIQAIGQGFDQEAAAVLISRVAVYKTEHEEMFDILPWLDMMLIRFMSKFASYHKGDASSFQIASNFAIYPQFMFHLRRSHFFQVFNNSPDETAFFRYMLNREDVNDSLIMIQPTIECFSLTGPPKPVLLASTSVKPDVILVADSFFRIILWYGDTIANWRKAGYAEKPEYAHLKQLLEVPKEQCQAIMKERFPLPRYIECDQGTSQARFLIAMVDPDVTHSSAQQGAYIQNSAEAIRTDDVSFKVFMEHLKKLAVNPQ